MDFVTILHVTISVLLIITILVQHRASGLSSTFGGSGAIAVQRRGPEKLLFRGSVILSIAFFALTILRWYL